MTQNPLPSEIKAIFDLQKKSQLRLRVSTAAERIAILQNLKSIIEANESEIYQALNTDLRKPMFESAVFEVLFTYSEIDFAIHNLKKWMRPKYIRANLLNSLTRNRIIYQPKGTCLIISPWNYPFQLLISPLVSALAAGNCCILKPSELAPATSRLLSKILSKGFPPETISVFEGDSSVAQKLLLLPFDHIFFTGSCAVGKVVMEAASKNLTSLTLELGGKSPAIVDKDANLKAAAKRICWGKWANAGQTCIAPDFVFVHESQKDAFIGFILESIQESFYKDNKLNTNDYAKMVSKKHFDRQINLLEDAISKGLKLEFGGKSVTEELTIEPTVVSSVNSASKILQEEIFGPLLPVLTYTDLGDVIRWINERDKPLALYLFSNNSKNIQTLLSQTSSGGVCVNDVLIHISNPNLPFGGVQASGTGSSHGFHGFKTFSHERAVMYQSSLLSFGKFIYPPYAGKKYLLKVLRWFM
jgi:aldehyde dehydrogenase (NAD+)